MTDAGGNSAYFLVQLRLSRAIAFCWEMCP
jgi:hypothetical protein